MNFSKRSPLMIANWKMHGSQSLIQAFFRGWSEHFQPQNAVPGSIVFCPPTAYLACMAAAIQALAPQLRLALCLGAQNLYPGDTGAFTGEVSASMLQDLGARYVLLGHSERRRLFAETEAQIASKARSAYDSGLMPVLCVGEPLAARQGGVALQVIQQQLEALLEGLPPETWRSSLPALTAGMSLGVIAYEPVWAIGTGLSAHPEQVQEVHQMIRAFLQGIDAQWAQGISILYGGSVQPQTASALWAIPELDGFLVGGASLEPQTFAAICMQAVAT